MAFSELVLIIFLSVFSTFSHAIVPDLRNITQSLTPEQNVTNLTIAAYANCTPDNSWLAPRFGNIEDYDFACQDALFKAAMDPAFKSFDLDTEHEFLDRGAIAQTPKPKIHLPRRYTVSDQRRDLPSCTIAIAMIASLRTRGPPLPGQPAQHYGLSDVMTPRELLHSPGFLICPFIECLRRGDPLGPALGWTQAGRAGNIGIFYMGTSSAMDRRIPRAIHPALVANA